jgi:hypothetical protein
MGRLGALHSSLAAITCLSIRNCTSVGTGNYGGLHNSDHLFTTERWHGNRWIVMPGRSHSPRLGFLDGVSCWSTTNCIAVGAISNGKGGRLGFAEQWQTRGWHLTGPVVRPGPLAPGVTLTAVSCVSASICFAVGSHGGGAFSGRWEPGKWTPLNTSG